jgi:C-terminal processing protease CtpA/Prc
LLRRRQPIEVAITRDIIRERSVRHRIEGTDVGYICITQFNEQTTEGLKNALSAPAAGTCIRALGACADTARVRIADRSLHTSRPR